MALAVGLAIGAGAFHFWSEAKKKEKAQADFERVLTQAYNQIRAEENFPASGLSLGDLSGEARELMAGAIAFNQGRFQEAIGLWDRLALAAPPPASVKLLSLSAAAHLRARNYGLAAQKYRQALAKADRGPGGELRATRDDLGSSLALFHLRDYEGARTAAEKAYGVRLKLLGPFHRETISSVNILASALMALQENEKALAILAATTEGALSQGFKESDPLLVDSANLLDLAFSLENGQNGSDSALGAGATEGEADGDSPSAPPVARAEPAKPAEPKIDFAKAYAVWSELKKIAPRSPLAPELLTALVQDLKEGSPSWESDPAAPKGSPPAGRDGPRASRLDLACALTLDLADFHSAAKEPKKALDALLPLLDWAPASFEPELLVRLGANLGLLGQWAEAEAAFREALELGPEKPEAKDIGQIVSLSLALAEAISRQGRLMEEAELELVGALTRLKKSLPKKELEKNLELARLYLYLAKLLKSRPRSKDSQNYYKLAEKTIKNAEKAFPEKAGLIAALKSQIPSRPKTPPPAAAAQPSPLPAPEAARLELAGYKAINRLPEFEPRIKGLMAAVEAQEGQGILYRRYFSLWLKYLEEMGATERLLAELDKLAQSPPGADKAAQSRFALFALNYKARVQAKNGQKDEALKTYRLILADPALPQSFSLAQIESLKESARNLEIDSKTP
jgi:Flp pilus assembly protein TadD